jgi:hypothetical protein
LSTVIEIIRVWLYYETELPTFAESHTFVHAVAIIWRTESQTTAVIFYATFVSYSWRKVRPTWSCTIAWILKIKASTL